MLAWANPCRIFKSAFSDKSVAHALELAQVSLKTAGSLGQTHNLINQNLWSWSPGLCLGGAEGVVHE